MEEGVVWDVNGSGDVIVRLRGNLYIAATLVPDLKVGEWVFVAPEESTSSAMLNYHICQVISRIPERARLFKGLDEKWSEEEIKEFNRRRESREG